MRKKSQKQEDLISILKSSTEDWDLPGNTEQVAIWNLWRMQNRHLKPCLDNIDFSGLNLSYADFRELSLKNTNFSNCKLIETDFVRADLRNSKFIHANLYGALLDGANLSDTEMMKANLWWITLVETKMRRVNISECKVYGVSPWNVDLEGAIQNDLDISRHDEERLTVDDLEVAHFTYLLINNKKLRNVIDTITSKVVLILGRFTDERKKILDALKNALRERDYVPMLFDFEPSNERDLTETVQLIANMANFVIADITEAKSIPQELSHIIPFLPSVPVKPILFKEEYGYVMFEHWQEYQSVLPIFGYKSKQHLLSNLNTEVLKPVNAWKNKRNETFALKNENKVLQEKIKELQEELSKQSN